MPPTTTTAAPRSSRDRSGSSNKALSPKTRTKKVKTKSQDLGERPATPTDDDEVAFFGNFCLNCSKPCSGPSAYCSEECRQTDVAEAVIAAHQLTYSPAFSSTSVPALIYSGKPRRQSGPPSAISSSPTSSVTNSPSPATFASGRLALLSSGPLGAILLEEEVTDLDLGEGMLSSHGNSFAAFGGASGGPSTDMGIGDDYEEGRYRPNGYFSPVDIALLGGTPGKSPSGTINRLQRSLSPTDTATDELPSSKRTIRERESTLRRASDATPSSTSSPGPVAGEDPRSRQPSKHAGLPALFHHAHPASTPSSEPTGRAGPSLPPSPAIKATVAEPSLTPTAARNTRRNTSRPATAARSTQSDPTVLLASAARASRASSEERNNRKDPKQRDARASLVAALGSKGLPAAVAATATGRSVSDFVTASSKSSSTAGDPVDDAARRRASMPLFAGNDATSSSGSSGISLRSGRSQGASGLGRLAGWQDKIKGVFGRAPIGSRWLEDSDDDEMTGLSMALDRSHDSLEQSPAFARPRPLASASEPVMPRRVPARQLLGKGNFAALADDSSLPSTFATSSASGAATTGALPTPERSPSRGRGRAPAPVRLTELEPVTPADFRGRSRRRGVPTAAVRSRSPDRSRSESKARATSAGPNSRRASVAVVLEKAGEEEEEEAAMEADLEDEVDSRGRRGRSRGRKSFGRDQSIFRQAVQLVPARPVGAGYTGGYGYYT